jgi:predicted MFS family arabinose efflux permease
LLSALLAMGAAATLPPLAHHLQAGRRASVWRGIALVLVDRNHQRAFVFSALLMFTGFTMLPYLTLYMQGNVGLSADEIPYLYLAGGVATLFTARLIGRLSDRLGKPRMFTVMALAVIAPMLGITLLPRWPLWAVLIVSTALFICMSGRMIPGMALVTGAATPALRGTFMAFNAAVQSAAMGLASSVGGLIIGRDADGLLTHYWVSALLGAGASLLAVGMVRRVRVHGSAAPQRQPV